MEICPNRQEFTNIVQEAKYLAYFDKGAHSAK